MIKTFEVILEVIDRSDSDGEDIEEVIQEILELYLPEDLHGHVVQTSEVVDEDI